MVGPATQDVESKVLRDMLGRGQWAPHEIAHINRQIENRKAQIQAGLTSPTSIWWTLKLQKEVDPLLRLRWEKECCGVDVLQPGHAADCPGEHGWVIDRWQEEEQCWLPIGVLGRGSIRGDLIEYLKSVDMQRDGAEEHLTKKRFDAEKTRQENERLGDQRVLDAVDSLPEKNRKNFLEVERAMKTGENVTARGAMKDSLEKMEEAGKKAHTGDNPGEEYCINPGQKYKTHKES